MQSERARRTYALLVTTLSSFLTPFMASSINLAVPAFGRELGATPVESTWVVSVYLVAAAAFLVPFGRLADLVGRKRVFLAGCSLYAVASALCALARSTRWLIALRGVQGVGGALLFGTAVAILTSVYPREERGRVLGVNTAAVYTGLSLGPVLGGWMTDQLGWRSLFWVNAALGLGIAVLAILTLHGEWAGAVGERFDWGGALLYAVALVALMYGVSSLQGVRLAPYLAVGGLLGLVGFGALQWRQAYPVLDLRRFRGNVPFIFSNLAALIHYAATFALTYLLSRYLQEVHGISARQAGLILLVQPALMAVLSPPAGWLSERIEPRVLSSCGMGLMAVGLYGLSFFGAETPLAAVLWVQALIGVGYALFSSPNTNAVMSSVAPRDYGVASSTLATMRMVGQASSMTIVLLILSLELARAGQGTAFADALLATMRTGFRLFTGLALVGMLASLARGRVRDPSATRTEPLP
ncbi:MAG: MFS transporter [Chloroflexia bacterium]